MNRNAARLLRTARMAAPALAACALTMAFAGPAAADPSVVTRQGGEVRFSALGGEVNTVTFGIGQGGTLRITDTTSTLVAGSGCDQVDNHTVFCGQVATATRIQASLGNLDDTATNDTAIASDIDGGAGDDRITGGSGNDRLTDPDGWNAATTGTTFSGRGGNDTVISRNGGYDRIACGGGFDYVVADSAALDTLALNHGCENVIR